VLTLSQHSDILFFMTKETTFGQRLRELRKAKNLSQRELADRVKLDFTYLSKIENKKMPPPSADAIEKLAKELDANTDELLALAGKVPQDLGDTLKSSEGARMFYRSASDMNLSEDDWKRLLQELRLKKGKH
jgi:transcriptional regulator with XRE-family HTH domain